MSRSNDVARQLGFSCYWAYLRSPLWRKIRRRVLIRDNHKCFICMKKATQVHHLRYTVTILRGRGDRWLKSICRKCHKGIHGR